jgi:thiol-disulfide isomerase/thioredoxin
MRSPFFAGSLGMSAVVIATMALPPGVSGQARGQEKPDQAAETLQAIDDDYNRQLLQLERRRIEQLDRLAARQKPAEAAATHERLFRLAISGDLFRDAEATAARVLEQGTPSATTNALAHMVKIIAEADRGAFDQSLGSLRKAVNDSLQDNRATGVRATLAPSEVIEICEAYYQRLVEGNQFPVAREAFRLVLEQPYRPEVKDFLSSRLKRIELVGKPAPPIRGTDLDGKFFDLAGQKGKVVLVVFWASWCLPNAVQLSWLEQVQDAYRNRGLQVVGINLDAQEDGGPKLETVLPSIRRFLLDYNVPWSTLVNGSGDRDYARAYGVQDIPANVVIGRDGTVVQVDVSSRNVQTVLSRLLGP